MVRYTLSPVDYKTSSMHNYSKLLEQLMTKNRMDNRVDEVFVEIVEDKPTTS